MLTKSRWDYFFVGLQLVLFVIYLLPLPQLGYGFPLRVGMILTVIGSIVVVLAFAKLNHRLSPFPTPVRDGDLVQTGVYGFARHPIYSGLLLAALGYALLLGSGTKLLVTALLALLFYYKSSYEEKLLERRFPAYEAYRKRVGRFGPTKFNR